MCNKIPIPSNTILSNFCVKPKPCAILVGVLLVK